MTDFGKLARHDPRTRRSADRPHQRRLRRRRHGADGLCDLIVVADHARFGLPEAKVGVFPMQVLVFLRSMIGARHINELCLTGELIDAARAREIGLANYVVPFEDLDARVEALAAKLARDVADRACGAANTRSRRWSGWRSPKRWLSPRRKSP